MSHYLHHVIEVYKDDKWQTFKVLSNPCSFIKDEHPDWVFKVGEEEFYYNSEFTTSYLMLRDNYFGHNPWRKTDIFSSGVPSNADEKTKEITKEWVDGHFHMYNCTMADLQKEAESVHKEMREIEKKEDIMSYTTEFARRLGFCGKEDPDTDYSADAEERIEDLMITYDQLNALYTQVQSLVETVLDECWFDSENIRIIIWTD